MAGPWVLGLAVGRGFQLLILVRCPRGEVEECCFRRDLMGEIGRSQSGASLHFSVFSPTEWVWAKGRAPALPSAVRMIVCAAVTYPEGCRVCPRLDPVLSRSVFRSAFPFMWLKGTFRACHPRFCVSSNSVQRRHKSDSNSLGFQLAFFFQSQTQLTAGANLVTKEKMNKTTLFLKINFFLLPYLPFPPCFTAASPAEFPAFKARRIQLDRSELAKRNCLSFALFGFLRGL